jgi:large subunit ribosomal protein L6
MSRIGKSPITLPSGVTCAVDGHTITVKGTKGTLTLQKLPFVQCVVDGSTVTVSVNKPDVAFERGVWGLSRTLVANMIEGVSNGFIKSLQVQGVGYKFDVPKPEKIIMSLGFSHKIELDAPAGITIKVDEKDKNTIHISSINKEQLGLFAAKIRAFKKPEPYKGKGIRYLGEHVRRKAGKTGDRK